jgi:O-antigen/teichoic acid export membrane protein/glycosyltransferase involved in cell wall biosynthesis
VSSRQDGVLARNAFYLLLGQVGTTILAVVLNAALARTLGAADFGIYFLLVSMSTFAYVVVEWGQSALLVREAAREPQLSGQLLGGALAFRVVVGLAATAFTGLLTRVLGYDPRTQMLAALMVLCGLPLALSQPYTYMFRARDRMDLDAAVGVAAKLVIVAVTLTVLVLGGHLAGVVGAQGVGGAIALLVAVLLARRIPLPAPRWTWQNVRTLAATGTPIAVFFVAGAIEPYLHAILLSKLVPAVVVGWYGAARNIMGVLLAPATILSTAAFPQFSRAAARPEELHQATRRTLRLLMTLGALAAVGTFLFADLAISVIYGPHKFGPAATVLKLFAPVQLVFFLDMLFATLVTAIGKAPVLAAAKLVSVIASSGLALVLVPICQQRYGNGGLGLVLAFGISEVVMVVALLILIPRGALDRGILIDLGRVLGVALGTLAVFQLLPAASSWVSVPGAVLLFAALSLGVGLVSRDDLSRVIALVDVQGREVGGAAEVSDPGARPFEPGGVPPLVSVVINNFNYARFLAQCVESGLAQTHARTEIVVVDDASNDGSREVIRSFGNRITAVLLEKNGGQGAAVNAGFAACRGDIIVFLDADDYLYPQALERIVAAWRAGISKLQYRLDLVDINGRTIDLFPAPEIRFDSGDVVPYLLRAGRYETTVTSGNAFARSALEHVLPVPEADFRISADGYLVTAAPFHGPVRSIEERLGAYRLHGANAWSLDHATPGDRLRRWLDHDGHKYEAVRRKARQLGLTASDDLGMRDHNHLATRLASLRVDPDHHPFDHDSRLALALRGALCSRHARLPWMRRVILAAWFLAVGLLPRPVALRAISWRLAPSSRSPSVARLLKTVRRMAR